MTHKRLRRNAWTVAAIAVALGSGTSLAAPDEEALGKSEGYPICSSLIAPEKRCHDG